MNSALERQLRTSIEHKGQIFTGMLIRKIFKVIEDPLGYATEWRKIHLTDILEKTPVKVIVRDRCSDSCTSNNGRGAQHERTLFGSVR